MKNVETAKETNSILDCEKLKIGNYYYLTIKETELCYLTFTKDNMTETRINNKYGKYKLDWIDNCTYKISIVESNSEYDLQNFNNKSLIFQTL